MGWRKPRQSEHCERCYSETTDVFCIPRNWETTTDSSHIPPMDNRLFYSLGAVLMICNVKQDGHSCQI